MSMSWSTIILTGGTSRRFGSDKSQASLSGYSLLDEILLALPSDLPIVVVGPEPLSVVRPVAITQEEPLLGGPVAGIFAGLKLVETELVGVIATDMPFAVPILLQLIEQLSDGFDAVIPIDAKGFRQPLAAIYRVESLRKAVLILGDLHGQSVRNLVASLKVCEISVGKDGAHELTDIDTPSDLENAIAYLKGRGTTHN